MQIVLINAIDKIVLIVKVAKNMHIAKLASKNSDNNFLKKCEKGNIPQKKDVLSMYMKYETIVGLIERSMGHVVNWGC